MINFAFILDASDHDFGFNLRDMIAGILGGEERNILRIVFA